ncbi:MAG: DsbA family oxidoreductase [Pseudomonadota bacterium]
MTQKIALEMVSDLVCPWCWLGLRRLKAAIDTLPDIKTEIYFRPYQLDPTVPEEGMEYRAYMKAKFGPDAHEGSEHDASKNRWRQMRTALEEYGAAEGIPFDFDNIPKRPNTVNAHRLVHWAQGQGLGLAAKEALFKAYFTDHRDIGDKAVLADIAAEIGLDRDIVEKLLASEADKDKIAEESQLFMQMGVRGVPTFIGNRAIAVQGAETAEKLAKLIRATAAQLPEERGRSDLA